MEQNRVIHGGADKKNFNYKLWVHHKGETENKDLCAADWLLNVCESPAVPPWDKAKQVCGRDIPHREKELLGHLYKILVREMKYQMQFLFPQF